MHGCAISVNIRQNGLTLVTPHYFQFGAELLTACVLAFNQETMKNKGDVAWEGAQKIILKK
jgi:hypothetical protein